MRRTLSVIVLGCLLAWTVACQGRSTAGDGLADLVGLDLAGLPQQTYISVGRRLAAATGEPFDPEAEREQGPRAVLACSQGVIVIHGQAGRWRLTAVDAQGRRLWQQDVALGLAVEPADWSIRVPPDHHREALVCSLPESGRIRSLSWMLTAQGPLLVRALDGAGRPVPALVSQEHPGIDLSGGRLEADNEAAVLAALLRLSQPAAREERQRSRVQTRAEALAASTDRWLAEAAAQLLIQP